jgi:hypothetical protein
MLISLLLIGFIFVIRVILSIIPNVNISGIPYIGEPVYAVLVNIMGYWNTFLEIFPYSQVVFHVFIYVILPFEFSLLILKMFLGHRLPVNTN